MPPYPHPGPPPVPRRPGRPPSVGADTPLNVKISQAELATLDDCAARLQISRAEAVRQGLRLFQGIVEREESLPRPTGQNSHAPKRASVAESADRLCRDFERLSASVTREDLETLLEAVLLATGDQAAGLYFLDCLRLHAFASGDVLAPREVAARFAGVIQARGVI